MTLVNELNEVNCSVLKREDENMYHRDNKIDR